MARQREWKIAIVGASGELGHRIVCRLLEDSDAQIVATSRDIERLSFPESGDRVELRNVDLTRPDEVARRLLDCEAIVFCPILSLSAAAAVAMRRLGSDARFILFSSNNVGLDEDSPVYAKLKSAESDIRALSEPWAMVRPTMIYGSPDDGNLGRLMKLARRSPVLPLMGNGEALQQPIHYDDLADLATELIMELDWRTIEISAAGPDIVSLSELYEYVIEAAGSRSRLLHLPIHLVMPIVGAMERFGMKPPLTRAQLMRADIDKLPTWPMAEDWSAQVSLEEGLAWLAEDLEES